MLLNWILFWHAEAAKGQRARWGDSNGDCGGCARFYPYLYMEIGKGGVRSVIRGGLFFLPGR